jgi:hypothetical protein
VGPNTTHAAATAHLVKPDGRLDDALLAGLAEELCERFGIARAAIQSEQGAVPCCPLDLPARSRRPRSSLACASG